MEDLINKFMERDVQISNLVNDERNFTSRFYLDNFLIEKKIDFIISFLKASKVNKFVIRVLFWDKLMNNNSFKDGINHDFDIQLKLEYKNKEASGIYYISTFNEKVFEFILLNHFNYELGFEPALNIKVELLGCDDSTFKLINFYDDRGFDVHW